MARVAADQRSPGFLRRAARLPTAEPLDLRRVAGVVVVEAAEPGLDYRRFAGAASRDARSLPCRDARLDPRFPPGRRQQSPEARRLPRHQRARSLPRRWRRFWGGRSRRWAVSSTKAPRLSRCRRLLKRARADHRALGRSPVDIDELLAPHRRQRAQGPHRAARARPRRQVAAPWNSSSPHREGRATRPQSSRDCSSLFHGHREEIGDKGQSRNHLAIHFNPSSVPAM